MAIRPNSYTWKAAQTQDSVRFKAIQQELRAMVDRLQELEDEVAFDSKTVKNLPKDYKSKANQLDFPKVADEIRTATTRLSAAIRGLDMGVTLAEIAEKVV